IPICKMRCDGAANLKFILDIVVCRKPMILAQLYVDVLSIIFRPGINICLIHISYSTRNFFAEASFCQISAITHIRPELAYASHTFFHDNRNPTSVTCESGDNPPGGQGIVKILEMRLPLEPYEWYLDLRPFGTVKHSEFGLGFEKFILFAT
ncbi:hypothetical protein Tco_1036167, partial [Tanacetum coccineum]